MLSLNEIRARAADFATSWQDAHYEKGETQSFYNDFFNVFGVSRRKVSLFEKQVDKLSGNKGFIDLFWPGMLLVEHKSAGRDLGKARTQALEYATQLKNGEEPKYILLSDFQTFELLDLESNREIKFALSALPDHIEDFRFITGQQKVEYKDQDPVNIIASELMGQLYDELKASGYPEHELELFMVRLLFCLFADDTALFPRDNMALYLQNNTREDGSDLGSQIQLIFQTVNTPQDKRQTLLNEELKSLPYVNGGLFKEPLSLASFSGKMRDKFLECCHFDWSRISPAIFGSLFQSVMDPQKRRGIGAHYTSEKNILKVIQPLFLDDLHAEFQKIKHNTRQLKEFHARLGTLTFLDPACGCGNFLILAYRELRELEIEVLKALYPQESAGRQAVLNIDDLSCVTVEQFYGIELEEFPARIAEVAMWLIDHLMNRKLSAAFGQYFDRLPLKQAAHIVQDNALTLDWAQVIAPDKLNYILGNPPFIGSKLMTPPQRQDILNIFPRVKGAGVLDYVCGWYAKAAAYLQNNSAIGAAFVSTNSITQGEQVGILWNEMFRRYGVHIQFAHRTFGWTSEARGKASVYVIIVGFGKTQLPKKQLFTYDTINSDPHVTEVKSISPYLVEGGEFALTKRTTPLCNVPEMMFGSQPLDGGYLTFSGDEYQEIVQQFPEAKLLLRQYLGSDELINNIERWILWLKNISPELIRKFPPIQDRISQVRDFRLGKIKARKRNKMTN